MMASLGNNAASPTGAGPAADSCGALLLAESAQAQLSCILLAEDANVASVAGHIDTIAATVDRIGWQAPRPEPAA